MKNRWAVALGIFAAFILGAASMHGLNAQAKPKAYTITELETINEAEAKAFAPVAQAAQEKAGGRPFRTGGGKIVLLEGSSAPKRVPITEWNSLEQAEAFYKSKAWTDLAPQRNKAVKTIRRYLVEATN